MNLATEKLMAVACADLLAGRITNQLNCKMNEKSEKFVINLAANSREHDEWLAVIRFGMGTLLEEPGLMIRLIALEARRLSDRFGNATTTDHMAEILAELGLKFSPANATVKPSPL